MPTSGVGRPHQRDPLVADLGDRSGSRSSPLKWRSFALAVTDEVVVTTPATFQPPGPSRVRLNDPVGTHERLAVPADADRALGQHAT